MALPDKENYRLVPYRFVINGSDADICKLEKLTNLFPDAKTLIELELFKMNNLQQMMDRLARIYTPTSAIDTRDDTSHVFLGPYHISLGPTAFGALQFRNISTALLRYSKYASNTNTVQQQKRRHEAALRRFRRSVRKLILIKSIIDQLRIASILTPYNQYELYRQGIYDLVLAGHVHKAHAIFEDEDFTEQVNYFRSINKSERDNPLLTSKFIKIQTLLHLLTPTPHQNNTDSNSSAGKTTQNSSKDETATENPTKSLIDSSICCPQHTQNMPLIVYPLNRSFSSQAAQYLLPDSQFRRNSTSPLRGNSSVPSIRSSRQSLPDLNVDDRHDHTIDSNKSKALVTRISPTQTNTNQEDAFINRVSTLLTNYLLSQQSTTTTSTHDKLGDSTESFGSLQSVPGSDDADVFSRSSSIAELNDFDKLLRRIKKTVDNNLSEHQCATKPTVSTGLREKLLKSRTTSQTERSKDELDVERSKSNRNRRKLNHSSKSQSFDETNLKLSLTPPGSYDSVEF